MERTMSTDVSARARRESMTHRRFSRDQVSHVVARVALTQRGHIREDIDKHVTAHDCAGVHRRFAGIRPGRTRQRHPYRVESE
jgi:hypothetical protein